MSNIFTNTAVPISIKYFRTTITKGQVPNDYESVLNASEFINLISQFAFVSKEYVNISKRSIFELDTVLEAITAEIEQ